MSYRINPQPAGDFGDSDEVIDVNNFRDVLDDIENKVYNALKKIVNIQGIDSIDECKEILEKLSNDLF